MSIAGGIGFAILQTRTQIFRLVGGGWRHHAAEAEVRHAGVGAAALAGAGAVTPAVVVAAQERSATLNALRLKRGGRLLAAVPRGRRIPSRGRWPIACRPSCNRARPRPTRTARLDDRRDLRDCFPALRDAASQRRASNATTVERSPDAEKPRRWWVGIPTSR